MKKKISLLGLILILVLSFTGCGKSETTEYDQVTLEQYAEFVVQNFEAMTTEQLESFSNMRDLQLDTQLMNAGLPVDGEDFLTMISSWEAAEEECGAYVNRRLDNGSKERWSLHSHLKQNMKTEMQTSSSVLTKRATWRVWMFLLIIQQEKSLRKPV